MSKRIGFLAVLCLLVLCAGLVSASTTCKGCNSVKAGWKYTPGNLELNPDDFISLFDGKTLDGWEVLPGGDWKVENGKIIGSQDKTERRHGMLLSEKTYSDFIVRLKYKALKGNSGFYFRSKRVKSGVSVNGFQAATAARGADVGGS